MARGNTEHGEGPTKKKVFLKVRVGEEHTEYTAAYDGLKFEGVTMGDKDDVKAVVRRMIRAVNELPDSVVKAAILVVNHVASTVSHGAKMTWGGLAVEFGDDERLKLGASLSYIVDDDPEEPEGWVGELMATFSGYDGIMVDSFHKVQMSVSLGVQIDYIRLYRDLLRIARHAYNAWPSY
jgi:hypothetical protein